jgi:predicted alpha-1,2-mannosidase
MKRRQSIKLAATLALLCDFHWLAQAKEPVDYIDPFIGTGHFGKTYPGAVTPAGMVQLSPDTITGGDNGSGYRYYHKTIQGFSFTHMTGVGWYGDLGNFLVTPTTGPLKTYYGQTDQPGSGYLSAFSHDDEIAQAGYYAVTLEDYKIRAEMTAAPHSGILRFAFPENLQSRIQIDLARRVGGTSLYQTVKITDDHTIEGQIECTPAGGGWGHGSGKPNYTAYYHAEFSQPFQKFGVWSAKLPPGPYTDARGKVDVINRPDFIAACQKAEVLLGCREKAGQHLGFYSEFSTTASQVVQLKVGISFVSIAGAKANLGAEIPDWNFEQVKQKTRESWANELNRIQVDGGTEDQKVAFYTALYHARLVPQIFADVNGDYPGGDGLTHSTTRFTKRTIFSGWDVYRSEFPLLTLIAPETVNDIINSFVELADQNKTHYFDRWEFLNAYSGCMNGSPAVVVLNDAYKKGIRNYDVSKAYADAVDTCERDGDQDRHYRPGSLSTSLENAFASWNLAELARQLGKIEDAKKFAARSLTYRILFDPNQAWTYDKGGKDVRPDWKGWFRAKDDKGQWLPWEGLTSGKTCTEATVYQMGWFARMTLPG